MKLFFEVGYIVFACAGFEECKTKSWAKSALEIHVKAAHKRKIFPFLSAIEALYSNFSRVSRIRKLMPKANMRRNYIHIVGLKGKIVLPIFSQKILYANMRYKVAHFIAFVLYIYSDLELTKKRASG